MIEKIFLRMIEKIYESQIAEELGIYVLLFFVCN